MSGEANGSESALTLIYTTFPDTDTAKRIAGILLERRLIACANLMPGMIAMFRWEGKAEVEEEVAAILKTRVDLVEPLKVALVDLHPYATPAFAALPRAEATAGFADWIRSETAAPAS